WRAIREYISNAITQAKNRIQTVLNAVKNVWSSAWKWIQNRGKAAWNWINKWVFGPFKQGLSRLQTAFGNVKDGIGKLWNQIKKKVRDPVVAVVNTVYNNGIRKFWNGIADKVGLKDKKLNKVTVPKFASGGRVHGLGGSKQDKVLAQLSPNEHVVNARAASQPGVRRYLDDLNAGRVPRRMDFGGMPAFAKGGRVTPLPGRRRGNTYAGHSPPGARDYPAPTGTHIRATEAGKVTQSRFGGWAGGHVRIRHAGGWETLYAHMSKLGKKVGAMVKAGSYIGNVGNTGNSFGSHLHVNAFKNGRGVEFHKYLAGAASGGGVGDFLGSVFGGVVNKVKTFGGLMKQKAEDVIADIKSAPLKLFRKFVRDPVMTKL